MNCRPLLLVLALLLPWLPTVLSAAGAPIEVIAAAELRAQPGAVSGARGWVQRGARGEQLGRRGGWVRVQLAERQGWLRVWQVRPAPAEGGNVLLRGLQRFSRGIAGLFGAGDDSAVQETQVVATIGVRGLDAGEFTEATPDPGALRRIRRLRASNSEAAAFARTAGLERRALATPETRPAQDWEDW